MLTLTFEVTPHWKDLGGEPRTLWDKGVNQQPFAVYPLWTRASLTPQAVKELATCKSLITGLLGA